MGYKLKKPVQFDISTYKLVCCSEHIKSLRRPYIQNKYRGRLGDESAYIWNLTHYDDENLMGTRLIIQYHIRTRSVMFE